MYFPPYAQLIQAASRLLETNRGGPSVTLPKPLFEFLLQAALTTADFDEDNYLRVNPDVRAGLTPGNPLTAHQHFVGYGYFEGRRGGAVAVDEVWYLQTYPDVAEAVRSGSVKSGAEHFELVGAGEGRAPSKRYLAVAAQWKALLVK